MGSGSYRRLAVVESKTSLSFLNSFLNVSQDALQEVKKLLFETQRSISRAFLVPIAQVTKIKNNSTSKVLNCSFCLILQALLFSNPFIVNFTARTCE